jgi:hypothetical protein
MQGACSNSDNPDLWFSETTDETGSGRIPMAVKQRMINDALLALSICSSCPITQACLAEGMKDENIDNGIWGGTLSGERILKARANIKAQDRLNRISFARIVREKQFV